MKQGLSNYDKMIDSWNKMIFHSTCDDKRASVEKFFDSIEAFKIAFETWEKNCLMTHGRMKDESPEAKSFRHLAALESIRRKPLL